jgi:hypothetical protein
MEIMTPEERRDIYPPFIVSEIEKEDPEDFVAKKITDFLQLLRVIWVISNKDYQERFWVRQELPMRGDNYMETMETFLGDGEAVLEANEAGRVSMTPKQREMLTTLYDMVEDFDGDPNPLCPIDTMFDKPENDAEIISHPDWEKIRQYAKLVYEELSGDDLDRCESERK